MRSTKASAAVERLKRRSGNQQYSMAATGDGHFYLVMNSSSSAAIRMSETLMLDAFVAFVNSIAPQTNKRISKLDTAFEKQLASFPHKVSSS
jgi:hypothetical protein